ncbi:unnamed protein product [Brachionus calyciflorus]|uniref:Uncharacterized protein n=1 Tax=Brachionus calyciflorus TaxID=104777 RepID=A0A814IJ43_9BILA|nr:unnamed protein product [Brachionus calyciflorus]
MKDKYFSSLVLILCWLIKNSLGSYMNNYVPDVNTTLIKDLNLEYSYKANEVFPSVFRVNFNEFGVNFKVEFKKTENIKDSDNIYVIDKETGKPVLFTLLNTESYEKYEQITGSGWATLIKNKVFNATNPFRLVTKNFNFI